MENIFIYRTFAKLLLTKNYRIMFRKNLSWIGLVGLVFMGLIIYACSADRDDAITVVSDLDIPAEFIEVGKLHNEGMDFIFERLKQQAIESVNNPTTKKFSAQGEDDISKFLKQATLDFCEQNKNLKKSLDICKYVLDTPKKVLNAEDINPNLRKLLDEIDVVLSKEFSKDKLNILKAQLDVINQKAASTLSETDAMVVYCTTSTGYYSFQYWMDNYTKWYFALNYPEILEQYNNEEFNQLQMKSDKISAKGWGWLGDLFDTVEGWYVSTANSVEEWWNNNGRQILIADGLGAAAGAYSTITTSAAGSLVFGPTGVVVATVSGAVSGAIQGSALGAVGSVL